MRYTTTTTTTTTNRASERRREKIKMKQMYQSDKIITYINRNMCQRTAKSDGDGEKTETEREALESDFFLFTQESIVAALEHSHTLCKGARVCDREWETVANRKCYGRRSVKFKTYAMECHATCDVTRSSHNISLPDYRIRDVRVRSIWELGVMSMRFLFSFFHSLMKTFVHGPYK